MLSDKASGTLTLNINEIYESLQGEGLLLGTPSVFVRLQGCNLRCPWCDQPESLGEGGYKKSIEDVLIAVRSFTAGHVVITGGEPFLSPSLPHLVYSLLEEGFSVQIETNGTMWNQLLEPLATRIHITCSPKGVAHYYVNPKLLTFAKEIKFVVDESLTEGIILREEFSKHLSEQRVVLQPESNRKDMFQKAVNIQGILLSKGFIVKVIPQVHKFLGIR